MSWYDGEGVYAAREGVAAAKTGVAVWPEREGGGLMVLARRAPDPLATTGTVGGLRSVGGVGWLGPRIAVGGGRPAHRHKVPTPGR